MPLILLRGDFWPPVAEVFAGGLLLLTLVTFMFTPCLYTLLIAPDLPHGPRARPINAANRRLTQPRTGEFHDLIARLKPHQGGSFA